MSATLSTASPVLVLGASGKTGRRVVERLRARGVPLRAASRSGATPFDWGNVGTWPAAVRGVGAAYITYYPDLASPGAADVIQSFCEIAVNSGVRRLVLLSGRGEPEAQHCEQIVRASGVEWTVVRASWFAQNFSEGYLIEPVLAGEVALPNGTVGEPFVDADDIADVVAAAITADRHAGQLYEVTGPRLLTFRQAVEEIARATRRNIRFVDISIEEYEAALRRAGLPEEVAALIKFLFSSVLDGRNESITDGVMRALGRPPRDFADYVRATAATGVWGPRA